MLPHSRAAVTPAAVAGAAPNRTRHDTTTTLALAGAGENNFTMTKDY